VVVLVGRARRARRHAQTGFGGLSETALPYPLESPLTKWDTRRATPNPILSQLQGRLGGLTPDLLRYQRRL